MIKSQNKKVLKQKKNNENCKLGFVTSQNSFVIDDSGITTIDTTRTFIPFKNDKKYYYLIIVSYILITILALSLCILLFKMHKLSLQLERYEQCTSLLLKNQN